MKFEEKRVLGSTGFTIGRLGLASSYGAPAEAFEEAFERGCNYFVWNTFFRGRSKEMLKAIKNIIARGQRDRLVIAMHSYGHNALLNSLALRKSLKALGTDYIDIMLLGYYSWKPLPSVLLGANKLKEKGLTRHIGLTGHNRSLFPKLEDEGIFDTFHVRYNAVHRGAEKDLFPRLNTIKKIGIVSFTATSWGQLLDPKKMPAGYTIPTAADCYQFVLSNPAVDLVLTGPSSTLQMRENLDVLNRGPMTDEELLKMRTIGDFIYGKN